MSNLKEKLTKGGVTAVIVITILAVCYGLSWIVTCGIIKLITMCFGLTFKWSIATGIWLIICILRSVFNVTVKKQSRRKLTFLGVILKENYKMSDICKDREALRHEYEQFVQTERGKEWKHFWQSEMGSERGGDFGDYLYDFYPEMLNIQLEVKKQMTLQENVNKSLMLSKVEQMHDFRGWSHKLPAFHFDKEWDVKIIPPFAGAIIRFVIDYNGKHVSVYFDAYSELGWMYDNDEQPIPYFEYYDGVDTHRYYLDESEQMMNDIRNFLNNQSQRFS